MKQKTLQVLNLLTIILWAGPLIIAVIRTGISISTHPTLQSIFGILTGISISTHPTLLNIFGIAFLLIAGIPLLYQTYRLASSILKKQQVAYLTNSVINAGCGLLVLIIGTSITLNNAPAYATAIYGLIAALLILTSVVTYKEIQQAFPKKQLRTPYIITLGISIIVGSGFASGPLFANEGFGGVILYMFIFIVAVATTAILIPIFIARTLKQTERSTPNEQ